MRASVDRRELQNTNGYEYDRSSLHPFLPSCLRSSLRSVEVEEERRSHRKGGREEGRKEQPGDRRRDRRARGWKKVILVSFVREGDRQDRISIAEKNSIRRENKNEIFACETARDLRKKNSRNSHRSDAAGGSTAKPMFASKLLWPLANAAAEFNAAPPLFHEVSAPSTSCTGIGACPFRRGYRGLGLRTNYENKWKDHAGKSV